MLGLTLDINKEKYTKLSVVLFPVVLKVVNFLLPYFSQLFPCCVGNLLSRYSPPIMQGATARKSVELVLFGLVFLLQLCQRFLLLWCLVTFGECCESTLGSYRVLRFYQHKIYNYNTCSFVQVDAFIVDM